MKIPSHGETEVYDLSDSEFAAVKLEESGQFWVTIVNRAEYSSDEKTNVVVKGIFDNNSNVTFLNTLEEVKEYLLSKAGIAFKEQFMDKP